MEKCVSDQVQPLLLPCLPPTSTPRLLHCIVVTELHLTTRDRPPTRCRGLRTTPSCTRRCCTSVPSVVAVRACPCAHIQAQDCTAMPGENLDASLRRLRSVCPPLPRCCPPRSCPQRCACLSLRLPQQRQRRDRESESWKVGRSTCEPQWSYELS